MRAARLLTVAAIVAGLFAAALSSSSAAPPARLAAAPTKRSYTTQVSYRQTGAGTNGAGGAATGVTGAGSFSAHLGAGAALAALVYQAAAGVPLADIAKGGSYVTRFDLDAQGNKHGLILVTFKVHSLGTACVTFTETQGKFQQGMSFVPVSGSFASAGGTARAAKLRVSSSFDETNVTGTSIEQFMAKGSARASTGKARKPSSACKALSRLPKS